MIAMACLLLGSLVVSAYSLYRTAALRKSMIGLEEGLADVERQARVERMVTETRPIAAKPEAALIATPSRAAVELRYESFVCEIVWTELDVACKLLARHATGDFVFHALGSDEVALYLPENRVAELRATLGRMLLAYTNKAASAPARRGLALVQEDARATKKRT